MALTPQENDIFMREVDDAVREDALRGFMARFGIPIAILLFVGLASLGGWLWWQHHQTTVAGERGREFSRAIDSFEQGRPRAAATAVDALAKGDSPTYRAAALMVQGNAAAAEGDARTAAARFAAVARDSAVPQELRDVALLRQTLIEYDTLAPEAVVARLRTIVADPAHGAFPSAAELTALAEMRRGNNRRAGELFRQISQAENVAESLKSRSVQMAGMLGVDAVEDGSDAPTNASNRPATRE